MSSYLFLSFLFPFFINAEIYHPLDHIRPGQLRFTKVNVDTKMRKLKNTKQQYDQGKSSLSPLNKLPIIHGPKEIGYVLVDGHHEYLACKKLGDTTIPIIILEDLSDLNQQQFYEYAVKKNHIYPVSILGELQYPKYEWFSWDDLKDDPNRLFASLSALHCVKGQDNQIIYFKNPNASQKPFYPLWIKKMWKKLEIAFIEFKISTQLYKSGIQYRYEMGTNPNNPEVAMLIEQARKVLLNNPIAHLELIERNV